MKTQIPASQDGAPLLAVRRVSKAFPGVLAVDGAELELRAGEVLGLVGENGAGKSTLLKVVTGAHAPDSGEVRVAGRPVTGLPPAAVARAGVACIYQEFNLVPQLTVRENLFLGREGGRIWPDRAAERERARAALGRLGAAIDPETRVAALDLAGRQLVEIARALASDCRVLIMDEPTAALTPAEAGRLFAALRDLRDGGLGVVFVSHRLEEVFALADRICVMRDGRTLGSWPAAALTRAALIERMVGRPLDQEFPPRSKRERGPVVLEARGLRGTRVHDVSFALHAGEVLGLAGLAGAGRTELARLLFGADPRRGGEILLAGRPAPLASPREAIAAGICLLCEDRKEQGLVPGLSARANFALPNLERWSRRGWISRRREGEAFARFVERLTIRMAGPEQPAAELSGGNQQKLLLARWLEREARVLVFDEPTRGVDVGAKAELYLLIRALTDRGVAVLVISSELPEVLGLSDRILVMREGRLAGELGDGATATPEAVMALAAG